MIARVLVWYMSHLIAVSTYTVQLPNFCEADDLSRPAEMDDNPRCDGMGDTSGRLFVHGDPTQWGMCGKFVARWRSPPSHALLGVSKEQRERLAASSGFCPRQRCQLSNSAVTSPECQSGCCFWNGRYSSSSLLGYSSRLTSKIARPTYRHHRIVVGGAARLHGEDSEAAFLDANEVFPGMIAMSCPALAGGYSVMAQLLAMIPQQKVALVITLDPTAETLGGNTTRHNARACVPWGRNMVEHSLDFTRSIDTAAQLERYEYTLAGQAVRQYWFGGWPDFGVPDTSHDPTMELLVQEIVETVAAGSKVLVHCHGGRGRSGTLFAIAQARLTRAMAVQELVDLVIRMRESRPDSCETPQQFDYLRRFANSVANEVGWGPWVVMLGLWAAAVFFFGAHMVYRSRRLKYDARDDGPSVTGFEIPELESLVSTASPALRQRAGGSA